MCNSHMDTYDYWETEAKKAGQAIQRVRELASAIGVGEAMLYSKVIEAQILKALEGEQ